MKNFNEKQNGHLVALTPIPTVPAGIFSGSKTSLDQVADGDLLQFLMMHLTWLVLMRCCKNRLD